MEIAPVSGPRFIPVAPRPKVADGHTPVLDIDDVARIESEPENGQEKQSYGGMNGYEDLLEGEEEEYEEPLYAPYAQNRTGRRLNCIA